MLNGTPFTRAYGLRGGCAGGLPRGRVVEVFGPEASGKTTLALHAVASAQAAGGNAVFVDAEHALDTRYAEQLGCDVDNLVVAQPDTGEQALEVVDTFVRSASVDIVVVDSVAALVPRAELEGEMGDPHMALQARLMSQALRKLTHSLARSNTLILFLNQIRSKVANFGYGPSEVTPGGNALKYYSSVRLDIRRTGSIKGKGDEIVGNKVRVKVAKNKLAPPFRTVEMEIDFGRGISWEGELLDVALEQGIMTRSGAYHKLEGKTVGRSRDIAKQTLREDHELVAQLEAKCRAALFPEEAEAKVEETPKAAEGNTPEGLEAGDESPPPILEDEEIAVEAGKRAEA